MKRVFSLIHSSPHSQLGDIVDNTPNDIETEDAFSSLNQERSKDNLINYAKCLVKQLRYKEALVIFNEVLSKDPNDLATLRLRAIRNMTTLCVKESLDDFLFLKANGYSEDVNYQIGLSYFYLGLYEKSLYYFEECNKISTDEMKVACMYWHTIAAWRCNKEPILLSQFKIGMDIGHHIGYDAALKLFTNVLTEEIYLLLLNEEPSDLEYSIFSYGYSAYLEKNNRLTEIDEVLSNIITRDTFWISFAYIAAYNDRYYEGKGRKI